MTISTRRIQLCIAGLATLMFAADLSAQVLPRNKDRETTKQTTRTVEREVQDAKDGEAVETQRTRTRVRGDADADRGDRVQSSTVTRTGTGGNILRSTQIIGAMVNVQNNQRFGKVTEVVFNDTGCISYLIVDVDGRMAPIPWQLGNYDYQQRVFLIDNFDQARIARIPTFTTYEQLVDDKYITQVNSFFNVPAASRAGGRADVNVRAGDADVRTNRDSADRSTNVRTDADAKAGTSDRSSSKTRTNSDSSKSSDQNKSGAKTEAPSDDSAPAARRPADSKSGESTEKKSNSEKDDSKEESKDVPKP